MKKYYDICLARWEDEPEGPVFWVHIAKMYLPEIKAAWDALTQEERDDLTQEVFFFCDNPEDFDKLYSPGNEDFYLVEEK